MFLKWIHGVLKWNPSHGRLYGVQPPPLLSLANRHFQQFLFRQKVELHSNRWLPGSNWTVSSHHVYQSIHLSIKDAFCPGLRWNRIWLAKNFSLTIHDLWETLRSSSPPSSLHFLRLPPLTLTCSAFSLSSAVLHPATFRFSNPPPSFLFLHLLFPSSLALNRLLARWCSLPA